MQTNAESLKVRRPGGRGGRSHPARLNEAGKKIPPQREIEQIKAATHDKTSAVCVKGPRCRLQARSITLRKLDVHVIIRLHSNDSNLLFSRDARGSRPTGCQTRATVAVATPILV